MGEKISKILKGEIVSSVFYILLGLCLILIPTQTVDVICKIVFGLILIGVGIYHIYIYIRGKETATIMDLLSGVMVFVLGVFLFMTPSIVIKLLPWMLGAFVLVDSLWKFKGAFLLKKGGQKTWSVLLIGSLIFIALGIVMLFGRFPKIMTLLIFSGWILVCNGLADIVFFIMMKLGLRKIAKKAEADKENASVEDGNTAEVADEQTDQTAAPMYKENSESIGSAAKKYEQPDVSENSFQMSKEKIEESEESNTQPENITDTENMPENIAASEEASTENTEDETSVQTDGQEAMASPAEPQVQSNNSRWEKEPESAEMGIFDVGKDVVKSGSLKDLLNSSDDEELEEWKD